MQFQLPSVSITLEHPQSQEQKYLYMARQVLSVDRQIDQKNVRKEIQSTEKGMVIKITARDVKLLRSCVTGILRHLRLTCQTIRQFRNVQ